MKNNILNPLINIDYLVLNCKGSTLNFDRIGNKTQYLEKQETGTKIFKDRYFLFSDDVKVATIVMNPYSKALDNQLIQIQFSNHLFYIYTLPILERLIKLYVNELLKLQIISISRLDISIDFNNNNDCVQQLVNNIHNKNILLAGRDKSFIPYYEFNSGISQLTGFSIGRRSSSRYLRVYNKTHEMTKNPKEYILNKWKANGLVGNNIWRCEYELSSKFFYDLQINGDDIFKHLFSLKSLYTIFQKAELNHFELKESTGKSELNKENTIPFFDWYYLMSLTDSKQLIIERIKKIIEPSLLVQKRLLKSVFREYYLSRQTHYNSFMLQYILNKYELYDYFLDKIYYYIQEFKNKQLSKIEFSTDLLHEHLSEIYE